LGIGRYEETTYHWRDSSCRTKFTALALSVISEASRVYILATEEAKTKYKDELCESFDSACRPAPQFVDFPTGDSPQALWEQFRLVKEVLRENRDCHIIFDITHGFRAQPFFAAGVLSFVRSVDEDSYDIEVVYGAWEAKRDNTTPVWDLTPFVELIQWSEALSLFLKTGNAHLAAEPMEQIGRSIRKAVVQREGQTSSLPEVDQFARALRKFGDDIATVRIGSLLLSDEQSQSSAAWFLQVLSQSRGDIAHYLPPVEDILDRLKTFVEPLVVESAYLNTPEGHRALVAIAALYRRWRRFAEAAIALREGWVTLYADDSAACPGKSTFKREAREQAEQKWKRQEGDDARSLAEIRNDIEHGGFQERPLPSKAIMERLDKWIEKSQKVDVERIQASLRELEPKDAVFLNLSNHPHANWDGAQLEAARQCAPHIEDMPFPAVDPTADETHIEQLAEEIVQRIPSQTTHAMVSGEYTLTVALVRRLQQKGIVCLSATTQRDVVEIEGKKVSQFRFVRFRSYPSLA